MRANKEEVDAAGEQYGANERDKFEPGGGADVAVKQEPIKVAPKIGRNDPCPCGSGKKYKHCMYVINFLISGNYEFDNSESENDALMEAVKEAFGNAFSFFIFSLFMPQSISILILFYILFGIPLTIKALKFLSKMS